MGLTQNLFGASRTIPQTGETSWGSEVTTILSKLCYGTDGLAHLLGSNIPLAAWAMTTGSLAASATLTQTHPVHFIASTGGAVSLSGTTAIADGPTAKNALLAVLGSSASDTVLIPDGANTTLNGPCLVELGQAILLLWDFSNSTWRELARAR
ncbi:MAG: hypothetical protein JW940_04505 [Polyangiaceae bacterium]|nr:hypothetical protein [Polyangiaceae bacterium]